jgi:hypothetical protein
MALAVVWSFTHQVRITQNLRSELVAAEQRKVELDHLRKENERLAALQVPARELEALRADHGQLLRLRGEIERLSAVPVETGSATNLNAKREFTPAKDWRNVGHATPLATVETALWAAAGGDLDTLNRLISISVSARQRTESLLQELPDSVRNKFGSPEQLIALLAAKDMAFGSVRFESTQLNGADSAVAITLANLEGKLTRATLSLHLAESGWSLLVPDAVVDRYSASVRGGVIPNPR